MSNKVHKFCLDGVVAVMSVFCALSLLAAPPSTSWTVTGDSGTIALADDTGWTFTLTTAGLLTRTASGSATALNFRNIPLPSGYSIKSLYSKSTSEPFMGMNAAIEELYWPSTLTAIADNSFRECSSLAVCEFPDGSLTRVGNYAFYKDSALTRITADATCPVHDTVTYVGTYSFYKCKLAGALRLPNIATISANAFNGVSRLGEVELSGSSITSVGNGAFTDCTGVTNLTLNCPALTSTGSQSFYRTTGLRRVVINCPQLTTLGASTFSGSTGLSYADIYAPKLQTLGNYAFLHVPFSEVLIRSSVFVDSSSGDDYTQTVVDGILDGVSAVASSTAKAKNCIVRVRKENLHDWMPYSSALADCEPDYAPSRTFGVWREGSRKAYLVSLPQETSGLSVHLY